MNSLLFLKDPLEINAPNNKKGIGREREERDYIGIPLLFKKLFPFRTVKWKILDWSAVSLSSYHLHFTGIIEYNLDRREVLKGVEERKFRHRSRQEDAGGQNIL